MANVNFLLFHGDLLLGLLATSVVGLVVFSVSIFWLWNRPPRNPALFAILYFLAAFVICVFALATNEDSLLIAAAVLSFPWTLLSMILGSFSEIDFGAGLLFFGVIVNSFLVYQLAKAARGRKQVYREGKQN